MLQQMIFKKHFHFFKMARAIKILDFKSGHIYRKRGTGKENLRTTSFTFLKLFLRQST